jgi:hypothetical protein
MWRNWPIVVLALALVIVVCVSRYTDPSYQDKQNTADNGSPSASVSPNQAGKGTQDAQAPKSPPFRVRVFHWPEGVTALGVLLTLFFIGWQAILMRQAVSASDAASRTELRAYLAVVIGAASYQDRETNTVFEADPLLINTGRTPAHRIRFTARAGIKPVPLPSNTDLPETGDIGVGETVLGAQLTGNMRAIVEGYQPDELVQTIKDGNGNIGLLVWGLVTYEDVFGDEHYTRFCQQIYWDGEGKIRGYYTPGRNQAT